MENYKNYKAETIGIPEFDKIREEGRLLFEYVRGSTAYGTNIPGISDIDTGGVYMCTTEELLSFNNYHEEVSDKKSDNKWFELKTFIQLLVKSNPNVLEALFIPDNCIIGEVHPIMKYLRDNRDKFLSKKCFATLIGYSVSQIQKARGLNKKIVNPIYERKTPLDFTYTFKKQGSEPILDFLDRYRLKSEFCGLNNIPHMNDVYGLFYDWGNHLANYPEDKDILEKSREILNPDRVTRIGNIEQEQIIHYRGLTTEEIAHTTQLRLSSINDKNDIPICHISYNMSGFKDHCIKYKEYKEWEKNRNPARYESNLDKSYDSKNVMHCFRLIHMGIELAEGKGLIIDRSNIDREFLLNVRNHKYEYDELINKLDEEQAKMKTLINNCNLPDEIDENEVNKLLINLRLQQLRSSIN